MKALTLSSLACVLAMTTSSLSAADFFAFVGTYTNGKSDGIYVSLFDSDQGVLSEAKLAAKAVNPSFVAIHPSGRFLYAVNEIGNFGGEKSGAVSAFAIDTTSGQLTLLNQAKSSGVAPCHLVVDKTGNFVLTANYGGGNCNVLEVKDDGSLGNETSFHQHSGSSVSSRQKAPHAHSINLDSQNRFAFVADLGLDQIVSYRFDDHSGVLTPNRPAFTKLHPGAGPRHFSFHPNGKNAYVINELNSTITVFAYDPSNGSLKTTQSISTLPKDFEGSSHTAEVVVHPSGKFLYGSNRGHDSIAVFRVDDDGRLELLEVEPTTARTPRNFVVDPTGQFLLAENQSSDNVVVFRIDPNDGKLSANGQSLNVPSPVCIRFLKR